MRAATQWIASRYHHLMDRSPAIVDEVAPVGSGLAPPGPPPAHEPRPAWRAPLTTGLVAMAGTVLVGVGNPNTTHVPLCPLLAITGLDCPLCGGLRATHALTRADLGAALDHNLLFTVTLPAILVAYAIWLARTLGWRGRPGLRPPSWAFAAIVTVAVLFGILRNLPALGWLGSGA